MFEVMVRDPIFISTLNSCGNINATVFAYVTKLVFMT